MIHHLRTPNFILPATLLLVFALTSCAKPNYSAKDENSGILGKPGSGRCTTEAPAGSLCVKVTWEALPTETQFGSFIFTLSDLASDRLDLKDHNPMSVILWMPSMGHGSSPVTVEKIAPGIYRAKKVFFNMKGDWEIQFKIGETQAIYALDI
jgi:hypothetical protein